MRRHSRVPPSACTRRQPSRPRGAARSSTGAACNMAIGVETTTIYADPHLVTDPRGVAIAAEKILGIDPNILYPELVQKKTHFLYLDRFADSKLANRFLAERFAGINSYPEQRRAYPQNTVAAQVIGFAGTDNKGLGGLELEYNKQLAGKPGKQTVIRDPAGRALDVIRSRPERQGQNVLTTLDHAIQANAEAVLRKTVATWGAELGDRDRPRPEDGRGARDGAGAGLQRQQHIDDVHSRMQRNRAITDTYEPGSTFKLVTIAGALSSGLVTPHDEVQAAVFDPRRRPRDPRCRVPPHRDDDRLADPRPVVERRRDHDRREARPVRARCTGSSASITARRPASTSPARAPASCCHSTSGTARRSGTCRSARASPSRRFRSRRRTPRSRTTACGCSRIWCRASAAR